MLASSHNKISSEENVSYYGLSKQVVLRPLALARFCSSNTVRSSHLSLQREITRQGAMRKRGGRTNFSSWWPRRK